MTNGTVDTMELVEKFSAVGFDEEKARALAEQFREIAHEYLVTKEYLDFKLKELKYQMIFSLGALIVAILNVSST